jgi:hypothetical protein
MKSVFMPIITVFIIHLPHFVAQEADIPLDHIFQIIFNINSALFLLI